MCRAYLPSAVQADLPDSTVCRIELSATTFDPGSNFQTDTWQEGVGDAGSNATTIKDSDPTTGWSFVPAMLGALVTWDSGASSGYITSVDSSTQVTITKNKGTDFAQGDTYTVKHADYEVPVSGYYSVTGQVNWFSNSVVADKWYEVRIHIDGIVSRAAANHASLQNGFDTNIMSLMHLEAGELVSLCTQHKAGVGTVDVYHTWTSLEIQLVQADNG